MDRRQAEREILTRLLEIRRIAKEFAPHSDGLCISVSSEHIWFISRDKHLPDSENIDCSLKDGQVFSWTPTGYYPYSFKEE